MSTSSLNIEATTVPGTFYVCLIFKKMIKIIIILLADREYRGGVRGARKPGEIRVLCCDLPSAPGSARETGAQ